MKYRNNDIKTEIKKFGLKLFFFPIIIIQTLNARYN